MSKVLGLIAGNGALPKTIVDEAHKRGYRVAVGAIHGEADESISQMADAWLSVRLGQLGSLLKFFKHEGVQETAMGGKITKTNLFKGDIRPDFEMVKALASVRDHSDDSLLGSIAHYLDQKKMPLLQTTALLSERALPSKGVLTKRKPTPDQLKDIAYGWSLAKAMGELDVGQTVVVKSQAVLAVEAVEGTDEAIKRGCALGGRGATVVKVAKPKQDFRFDVPTVGLDTLDVMTSSGVSVLAIEARRTILLDRDEFLKRANQHKCVVISCDY